jgi:multidrug efflux pump subunit AcrB
MTGVAGAYFQVLTNTMIITLVCSFFVTWIGLPVIYLLLTRKPKLASSKNKPEEHHVHKQRWVRWFILRPWLSLAIVAGFVAVIIIVPRLLKTGFLPDIDEGSIVLDYSSPPGTSLEETDRMLREVEKIIVKQAEVAAYSRRTGTQMGFFITEPNRGDYLISLKKNRDKTTDEVISELRKKIASTQPALIIDFGQVIGDMLGDLMETAQPIEVKVYGNNRQVLEDLSKQIAAALNSVKGTADVFDGIVIAGPSVSITPDYDKLAQYNVTPANLQSQTEIALQGTLVGNLFDKQQLAPIRMVYPGNRTLSVSGVKDLNIFLPKGNMIPISRLAKVDLKAGEAEINRENLQSMGIVSARLEGSDLGTVMPAIKEAVAKINLPQGYHVEYGGADAEQQQSFKELLMILVCACLLVFGVILFLFKQFRIAVLILIISVLGTSGSLLALFITDTPLNVGSYTGLIMIVGIIGENAIFTFLQFKQSVLEGSKADDAIIYSISTRLRPKLMTALGAIIALMPLALGIGAGAQLHQPLAIAVIGGFLAALPLLLIVLPSMLQIFYKKGNVNPHHHLEENGA